MVDIIHNEHIVISADGRHHSFLRRLHQIIQLPVEQLSAIRSVVDGSAGFPCFS